MRVNLSGVEIRILGCIGDNSLSITDIRKKVGCSTKYSTTAIQRLSNANLISSVPNGRKKLITIKNKPLAQACSIISRN